MAALAGEQRPRAGPRQTELKARRRPLSVAIVIVPMPGWSGGGIDFDYRIDHLYGVTMIVASSALRIP